MILALPPCSTSALAGVLLEIRACLADARAEHADRLLETAVTAADATAGHARQTTDFSGNVVVSQGMPQIRADRAPMGLGANGATDAASPR